MNGESSKRGAVEEIISKRLRVLNKKIVRVDLGRADTRPESRVMIKLR
jgi:hypothetical protein